MSLMKNPFTQAKLPTNSYSIANVISVSLMIICINYDLSFQQQCRDDSVPH